MNRFIWQLYCDSSRGKKAVAAPFLRFARWGRHPGSEGWRAQVNAEIPVSLEDIANPEMPWEDGGTVPLRSLLCYWFGEVEKAPAYEQLYRELLENNGLNFHWEHADYPGKRCLPLFGGERPEDAQTVATYVGAISTVLHWLAPDVFIPYYFEGRFALFSEICRAFGIVLPEIPGKLQKKERVLYYLTINRLLQEFRLQNQFSPKELNAFLYDFAPSYLAVEQDQELPAPQRAWFLMAGVGTSADFDLLDNADDATESHWRGHRDARRGDIAIVWCASPRAYLHSIWRIVEDGYDDPFTYWYSLVRIGRPIPVPHLKINDLKANPALAESPMVRAHFQGCAGKYFQPKDYPALLDELQRRNANIDALPRLAIPQLPKLIDKDEILDERTVELRLIEPLLLNKLGYYDEQHWQRQIRVRMGRGEKVYPDYVIGYQGEKGEERAAIIVESKYRIATQKELFETFLQGRSYALRLRASWLMLAALEGVWLLGRQEDFSLESARHWSWEALGSSDEFSSLERLVGSKVVTNVR